MRLYLPSVMAQEVIDIATCINHLESLATGREYTAADPAVVGIFEISHGCEAIFWGLFRVDVRSSALDSRGRRNGAAMRVVNKALRRLGCRIERTRYVSYQSQRKRQWAFAVVDCPVAIAVSVRALWDAKIPKGIRYPED